jgi:hypothetical protein
MLSSAALAPEARRPKAAGATSICWKSFIERFLTQEVGATTPRHKWCKVQHDFRMRNVPESTTAMHQLMHLVPSKRTDKTNNRFTSTQKAKPSQARRDLQTVGQPKLPNES